MKHCKMKIALKNAILTLFIGVTAAICCFLGLSFLNFEESVQTASAATDFASEWSAAVAASSTENPQTFTLTDDWIAPENSTAGFGTGTGFDSGRLYVPSGKSIILDLNGHTIDRNCHTEIASGGVIYLTGTLVIKDTSDGETGKITGGYAMYSGGVYMNPLSGALLTLESGSISGNYSYNNNVLSRGGGAVFVGRECTFTMFGGTISDNSAAWRGGGLYVEYTGTFIMNGGTINNNTAESYGGCIYVEGTVVVNDGIISNNTSVNNEGAVYVGRDFTMTGGAITGNYGYGILMGGSGTSIHLSGSAAVYDNYKTTTIANIVNSGSNSKPIVIEGALTGTQKIGVTGIGVITSGYSTYCGATDPSTYFTSDSGYPISLSNGEVVMGDILTVSQPTWEDGTTETKTFTYNGSAQGATYADIPNVTVSYSSGASLNTSTRTISATNVNVSSISSTAATTVSNYYAKFTPKSGYCWSDGSTSAKYLYFCILPKQVDVIWDNTSLLYTGSPIQPTATIADGALIGSDTCGITISGAATEIGPHTATAVSANKNYCFGSVSASGSSYRATYYTTTEFTITKPALTDTTTGYSGTYDGEEHGITVSVTGFNEGDSLSDGTIKYGTAEGVYNLDTCPTLTNVGTLTVYYEVTFDNYETVTGSATVTIDSATLTDTTTGYNGAYDGAAHGITVSATGFIDGESLSDGTIKYGTEEGEYELDTCPTQTNAGTLTVYYEVTFDNYETVTGSVTVTVTQRDISNVTVTVTGEYEENGTEIVPTFTVTDGEIAITEADYTVAYTDNVNAGTATITLTGSGNYTGTKTQTFEITSAPEPEEPDEPDVPVDPVEPVDPVKPEEPTPETPDKTGDKEPSKGLSTVSIVIIVIVALVVVAAIAASLAVLFKKRKD